MNKHKSNKLIWVLLIFFTIFLIFLPPVRVEATNNEASSYYQYRAKETVIEALNDRPEISYNKKLALVRKLIEDGFFKMTTKQEKLDYIHANLPNNRYLLVVADALDIHSDNVSNSSIEIDFQLSQDVQEQIYNQALLDYKQWAQFYINSCKEPGRRHDYGNPGCFTDKGSWRNHPFVKDANLYKLYNQYWPDLKHNLLKYEFTQEEKTRLLEIYNRGNFEEIAKNFEAFRPPGSIGFFGNSPIDDVLIFVPVEKLAAIGGKALIGRASGLFGRQVVEAGEGAVKRAVRIGAQRASARIRGEPFFEISSRYLRNVVVNMRRMFGRSELAPHYRKRVARIVVDSVDNLSDDFLISKYVTPGKTREIIDKTEVWSYERMRDYANGKNWAGFARHNENFLLGRRLERVVLEETQLLVGLTDNGMMANKTVIHEALHCFQSDKYLTRYFSDNLGYNPMVEGMNNVLTHKHLRSVWQVDFKVSSYKGETAVAQEIVKALNRKYNNPTKGYEIAAWAFFEGGLNKLDNYLGTGVSDYVYSLMDQGRYAEAINYLRKIN